MLPAPPLPPYAYNYQYITENNGVDFGCRYMGDYTRFRHYHDLLAGSRNSESTQVIYGFIYSHATGKVCAWAQISTARRVYTLGYVYLHDRWSVHCRALTFVTLGLTTQLFRACYTLNSCNIIELSNRAFRGVFLVP